MNRADRQLDRLDQEIRAALQRRADIWRRVTSYSAAEYVAADKTLHDLYREQAQLLLEAL